MITRKHLVVVSVASALLSFPFCSEISYSIKNQKKPFAPWGQIRKNELKQLVSILGPDQFHKMALRLFW